MTRSGVAPGAAIHSALTPLALPFSQITSAGRRSLIRSIPARRCSVDALGFCGCDLIRSITLFSCSLAIFPPSRCAGYSDRLYHEMAGDGLRAESKIRAERLHATRRD